MKKLIVVFKQQNPEFNKDYAKQYFEGKESSGNHKDLWSRGFNIIIKELEYFSKTDYSFILLMNGHEKKNY